MLQKINSELLGFTDKELTNMTEVEKDAITSSMIEILPFADNNLGCQALNVLAQHFA